MGLTWDTTRLTHSPDARDLRAAAHTKATDPRPGPHSAADVAGDVRAGPGEPSLFRSNRRRHQPRPGSRQPRPQQHRGDRRAGTGSFLGGPGVSRRSPTMSWTAPSPPTRLSSWLGPATSSTTRGGDYGCTRPARDSRTRRPQLAGTIPGTLRASSPRSR
jgi:hypothetical protein